MKPKDPDYWKKYRAAHPEYRQREIARVRRHKQTHGRGDRHAEYARYYARTVVQKPTHEPLPVLFPGLVRGTSVSFWEDELRMDLEQERALALLEGRDPDAAIVAYRKREVSERWRGVTFDRVADVA